MLKIVYDMETRQEWAFGRTNNTEERTFWGKDEYEIREQIDAVAEAWYDDPAVKSVQFIEKHREEVAE